MLFRRPMMMMAPLALLLGLAGCQSPAERAQSASPDYKVGYDDGCASAGNQGANTRQDSTIRDDQAYGSNPAYHAGWGTGFNACRLYQAPPVQPGEAGPAR